MTRASRVADAIWTAFTESLRFIVVPLVLVNLVKNNYPQIATAFMPDLEMYVIFFGCMITASSTLEAGHRPGTYKRMLFGLAALGFLCMWFFTIFGGGVARIDYGPFSVVFDMSKVVYIILFGMSLKGLLVVQTFSVHRKLEEKRIREKRAQLEKKRREVKKAVKAKRAPQKQAPSTFSAMSSAAFEVTADDAVGYVEEAPPRLVPPGTKVCEICGAEAPSKDYVCRHCGAWFPRDSVE